jgi:hypothetical protein
MVNISALRMTRPAARNCWLWGRLTWMGRAPASASSAAVRSKADRNVGDAWGDDWKWSCGTPMVRPFTPCSSPVQ